jgi:hypothetical protein
MCGQFFKVSASEDRAVRKGGSTTLAWALYAFVGELTTLTLLKFVGIDKDEFKYPRDVQCFHVLFVERE